MLVHGFAEERERKGEASGLSVQPLGVLSRIFLFQSLGDNKKG